MKRKLVFCTAICLLVTLLTGCQGADYKKAQNLYAEGDYAQAKAIFLELADYEDSQEMVTKCTYGMAMNYFEDKDYAEAHAMFTELGDYQDSRNMVRKCSYHLGVAALEEGDLDQAETWLKEAGDYEDAPKLLKELPGLRLMRYLRNNGDLSAITKVGIGDASYVTTLRQLSDDTIEIIYDYHGDLNTTVLVSETYVTMVLKLGDTQMQVQGTSKDKMNFLGKITESEESAQGELDIRTYQYGNEMLFDNHYFKGYNIYGEPLDPKKSSFFLSTSNAPLERAFTSVEAMLEENQVGVTLYDLGFASLK